MRSCIVAHYTAKFQNNIYNSVNEFSRSHKNLGRLSSLGVSIIDVALQTMKTPLQVIEYAAVTMINLLGALFSNRCSLKHALDYTEHSLGSLAHIPVSLVMVPIKLFYQLFAIAIDPENVRSINPYPAFGNPNAKIIF